MNGCKSLSVDGLFLCPPPPRGCVGVVLTHQDGQKATQIPRPWFFEQPVVQDCGAMTRRQAMMKGLLVHLVGIPT